MSPYTDKYGDQNKNSHLAALVDSPNLETIDHPRKHHLENNNDHSSTEHKKKNFSIPVGHPEDWVQFAYQCTKKPLAVKIQFMSFWVVVQCSVVVGYQHIGGLLPPPSGLKMEVA
jgi:hypothetical protein